MLTWTCTYCNTDIPYKESKHPRNTHRKLCLLSPKKHSDGYWPIPVLNGVHCCAFLYRNCRYSGSIDRVREHCRSAKCCGPEDGATPSSIYKDALSLSPPDLGQYISNNFLTAPGLPASHQPSVRIFSVLFVLHVFTIDVLLRRLSSRLHHPAAPLMVRWASI